MISWYKVCVFYICKVNIQGTFIKFSENHKTIIFVTDFCSVAKHEKVTEYMYFVETCIEKWYNKLHDLDGILTASLEKSSGFVISGTLFCSKCCVLWKNVLCVSCFFNFSVSKIVIWAIFVSKRLYSAWFEINDSANNTGHEKHSFAFFP